MEGLLGPPLPKDHDVTSLRAFSIFLAASAAAGCAHAPSTFPVRSAASPEAATPAPAIVARALTEEPPHPGGSTEGWTGLGSAPTVDPHAGHHGHHGHPMHHAPAPEATDAGAPPEEPVHAH
jgi:hypothetical protein